MAETPGKFAIDFTDYTGILPSDFNVQMRVGLAEPGSSVRGIHIENLVIKDLNGQEAFNRIVLEPLGAIYSKGYQPRWHGQKRAERKKSS